MAPTQAAHTRIPVSDVDPYSDEALIEPWGVYRELQSLGSAVWLRKYGMFALTRYDSVIRALRDTGAFSSAFGETWRLHPSRRRVQRWIAIHRYHCRLDHRLHICRGNHSQRFIPGLAAARGYGAGQGS
jgi:cytochrome P450